MEQEKIQQAQLLEIKAVETLKEHPQNPRKHPPSQIRALAENFRIHGMNAPILLDKNNQIIAGHARLAAARLLGLKEVPTITLSHLSDLGAKSYMLADNKLSDRSSWDDVVVANHLKDLAAIWRNTHPTCREALSSVDLVWKYTRATFAQHPWARRKSIWLEP